MTGTDLCRTLDGCGDTPVRAGAGGCRVGVWQGGTGGGGQVPMGRVVNGSVGERARRERGVGKATVADIRRPDPFRFGPDQIPSKFVMYAAL